MYPFQACITAVFATGFVILAVTADSESSRRTAMICAFLSGTSCVGFVVLWLRERSGTGDTEKTGDREI
jgi:hypothetical protein